MYFDFQSLISKNSALFKDDESIDEDRDQVIKAPSSHIWDLGMYLTSTICSKKKWRFGQNEGFFILKDYSLCTSKSDKIIR